MNCFLGYIYIYISILVSYYNRSCQPLRKKKKCKKVLSPSLAFPYFLFYINPPYRHISNSTQPASSMFASSPSSFIQYPFQLSSSKAILNTKTKHFYTAPPPSTTHKFRPHKTISAYSTTGTKRPHNLNFQTEHQMASTSSLYEVLGIPMSASGHEIKSAYRKLARMCHPDVVSINQKETSANEFMKIHAAYSTLSDPDKRANYDREIYGHRRGSYYGSASTMTSSAGAAAAAAMSGFSGYSRRTWETDQCW